ncbi:MAG: CBS domain-containing protein [Bacillota bacterium]
MFVRDEMTVHSVSVKPTDTLRKALDVMQNNSFEGLPVQDEEHVVGVITMWDLLMRAVGKEPSYIDTAKVSEVMSAKVFTVNRDEIIEEAAYIMHKYDLDILPVVDEQEHVVGVISESDLFRVFVKMLGLKERGTRVSVVVEDRIGQIAEITRVIKENGISLASVATTEPRHHFMNVVLRLRTTEVRKVVDDLRQAGFKVVHVSQVWE